MSDTGLPHSPSGGSSSDYRRPVKAIDIKTSQWHDTIEKLVENGWTCIDQYEGVDAGIDYNSYTLQREQDLIKFEWYNWTEGEFKCSIELLREIERLTGQPFTIE